MQNSGLAYARAPRDVVLGAALALLLDATPASRGGAAPPVGPGLARLVRLDRAGFLGAGVQLRRLNRSLGASRFRQVLLPRAPFRVAVVSRSHTRLPWINLVLIM